MDRTHINQQQELQVSLEEIVAELNKQISSLNFELTASRLAIQKLQNALHNADGHTHENDQVNSKINMKKSFKI
jgi:uncharacterized coiled-coil protein SlyX